jgi:hypothetical protein
LSMIFVPVRQNLRSNLVARLSLVIFGN